MFNARRMLLAAAVVMAIACGKRGDPHPPVPIIPKATSDLTIAQRGTKVLLSWSYPSLATSGRALKDVGRVIVYRHAEQLPVPQAGRDPNAIMPGDVDPTIPEAVSRFSKIPTLTGPQFLKLKETADSLDSSNLPAATAGSRLSFEDTPPFHTTDGRAVRLSYAVVTESHGVKSELSNLATLVPLDVAVAPPALTATAKPEGISLSWTKPEKAATGAAKPVVTGYNVYRSGTGALSDDLGTPVNGAPITATTYLDAPPYGDYQYRVTAIAAAGPPRTESDPSAAASVTFKDLTPPPAPTGVNALVGTKSVNLVWDAVTAPDIWGYLIYRIEGKSRLKLTPGPVTATHFEDISVDPGIEYTYEVTSLDKNKNESAPTKSEPVLVPKTP
jgi:hypothetical protein